MLTVKFDSRFADYISAQNFAAKLVALNPEIGTLCVYFDIETNFFRVEDLMTQSPITWKMINSARNPHYEPTICLCTPGVESCRICGAF